MYVRLWLCKQVSLSLSFSLSLSLNIYIYIYIYIPCTQVEKDEQIDKQNSSIRAYVCACMCASNARKACNICTPAVSVCMYVCTYVHMACYGCYSMYVTTVCIGTSVCMHAFMSVCLGMLWYVCMYVCNVLTYVCMYV